MRDRPIKTLLPLAAAAAACLWAGLTASAGADSNLQNRIDTAREQAQSLASKVQTSQNSLKDAEARAHAAAAREEDLSALLANGVARAKVLDGRVHGAEASYQDANGRFHRAIHVLARRLVQIYKGNAPDAADLILESDGFDDLVTRTEYLKLIESSDANLAGRVRSLRNEVLDKLESLRKLKTQADQYANRLAAAQAQIAGARAAAAARAAALANARAAASGSLSSLRGKIGDWESQLQQAGSSPGQAQRQVGQWFGQWAIPEAIVMCESHGNLHAYNPSSGAGGAYQILPSTWKAYGGHGLPQNAPKSEQDRIAAAIWRDGGPSQWVCQG